MATLKGNNYADLTAIPQQQLDVGDVSGKIRMAYDEITLSAELASGDIIKLGAPLPKNARILDAGILSGAMGAPAAVNCQVRFGHDGDDDAFIAQSSVAAAVKLRMASEAGLLAKLDANRQPQITINTASSGAAGKKIQAWIEYVLE